MRSNDTKGKKKQRIFHGSNASIIFNINKSRHTTSKNKHIFTSNSLHKVPQFHFYLSFILFNHTMLLRTSITKYKKLFQKTLTNFKSLFSPTYQKIPKTPLHNHSSYNDLEKFYTDFTRKWDSENGKTKKRSKNKLVISSSSSSRAKQEEEKEEVHLHFHNHNDNEMEKKQEEFEEKKNKRKLTHQRGKKQDSSSSMLNSKTIVEKKMKELEMLEMSNMDYILDIEEVLHYYTRLTCPSYVEIVDKFFMQMYYEFLDSPKTPPSVNSKPL